MPKTYKMTPRGQVYTWTWSWSWTCKALNGLLLLLYLVHNSISLCPENKTDPSTEEIGTAGTYKDLICQVTEQCKVSWQQDGVPLNLTDDGRIYCESECNCRALKFKSLDLEDEGNYTCLGETGCEGENLPQQTYLRVDEDHNSIGPIITVNSECQDKVVHPGEDVTFCCVCQVGTVSDSTFTYWEDESVTQNVSKGKGNISSCITLHDVNKTSEGNYTVVCSTPLGNINNTLKLKVQPRWSLPKWEILVSVMMAFIVMTVLMSALIYRTKRTEIQLLYKDQFGKQEQDDGKDYDAYISYYWSDGESSHNPDRLYALDLKQRLTKLGYTVCLAETDFLPGNETSEEIVQSLTRSRRYIILLSPQFLTYRYMSLETEQCLDIIKQNKKEIIPIFIREISPDVIKAHVALDHIVSTHPRLDWQIFKDSRSQEPLRTLSMENGNHIEMEARESIQVAPKLKRAETRVWSTLRLQMPPVPRQRSSSSSTTEQPLSSVEADSLIENAVLQEDSMPGENPEAARHMPHVV
eukprot:XP_011665199.1 PREDICTED: X-linked interleukin-1 receptor accessory protein-like 2 isoform X2 [Strongylocentrotus purpuratus]